jgi:hypothetical protein
MYITVTWFFSIAQQHLVGQGLLIIEAPRSHSDTPHSVGLLWTSYQPDAETSTWRHITLTRNKHPSPPQNSNPQANGIWPTRQIVRPLGSTKCRNLRDTSCKNKYLLLFILIVTLHIFLTSRFFGDFIPDLQVCTGLSAALLRNNKIISLAHYSIHWNYGNPKSLQQNVPTGPNHFTNDAQAISLCYFSSPLFFWVWDYFVSCLTSNHYTRRPFWMED